MAQQHDSDDKIRTPQPTIDTPAGGPTGGQGGAADRVGDYGGDDGAMEHESGETNTPEDTGSKVEPGRKDGL